jgi:3-oxoacyl-[acyl-carrier protein] reductase
MSSLPARAEALASGSPTDGFRVLAVARRDAEAPGAATKLAERGPGAVAFCPLDLSNVAAIPTFVRELRGQFGPIYGLVNNAGLGTAGLLATMPDAEIQRLIQINTVSPDLAEQICRAG